MQKKKEKYNRFNKPNPKYINVDFSYTDNVARFGGYAYAK